MGNDTVASSIIKLYPVYSLKPRALYPGETAPHIRWIGNPLCPIAGLVYVAKSEMSAFPGNRSSIPCSCIARRVIVMSANSGRLETRNIQTPEWETRLLATDIATWRRGRWVSISRPLLSPPLPSLPTDHQRVVLCTRLLHRCVCTALRPCRGQTQNASCEGRHVEIEILLEAHQFDTRTIRL